jgi:flagellar protein FliL
MEEKDKKPESAQKNEEKAQQAKKRSPINIIIICILGLCLIGGGLFVWKGGILSKFTGKEEANADTKTEDGNEESSMYEFENFIVNLSGGAGNNYLKVKIDLELNNKSVNAEIEKKLPQFRDAILTLLSSKTYEEVKTLEGKSQIRAEVLTTLNQFLKTGKVINIYFGEFIVQ